MANPMTTDQLWSDPGAVNVAPGVHRLALPLPTDSLKAVNVYAIEDAGGLVMIDAGWALSESRATLEAGLASLGHDLGDITRFLVTHVHRDHYTQAPVIRREFGTRVELGFGEEPALRQIMDPAMDVLANNSAKLRLCGAEPVIEQLQALGHSRATEDGWELPDAWLQDAQLIELSDRTLEVIHTPGHTRGHVVFVDRAEQLMFSGDHVLPHITPSIGLEPTVPNSFALRDYLESLQLVRAMPDLRMLPAHGQIAPSIHARADELLHHHEVRLEQSLAAIRAGAVTAYQTAVALTWTRRERSFDSLDVFNQMLATTETAAHLDVLMLRGVLSRTEVDGVRMYALV